MCRNRSNLLIFVKQKFEKRMNRSDEAEDGQESGGRGGSVREERNSWIP